MAVRPTSFNSLVFKIEEAVQKLRENWAFSFSGDQIEQVNKSLQFIPVNGGYVILGTGLFILQENGSGGWGVGQKLRDIDLNWLQNFNADIPNLEFDPVDGYSSTNYYPLYPYYFFGNRTTLIEELKLLSKSLDTQLKYPMIHLLLPFESTPGDRSWADETATVEFTLCAITKPDITTRQRYEKNFLPVLYPLRECFLTALLQSGFTIDFDTIINADNPFWGRQQIENSLQDYADAISLSVNLHVPLGCEFKQYFK